MMTMRFEMNAEALENVNGGMPGPMNRERIKELLKEKDKETGDKYEDGGFGGAADKF